MKISALPNASTVAATDLSPVVQDLSSTPVTNAAEQTQIKTFVQTGVTDGSSASAGIIGEVIQTLVASGSAVSLTTATAASIGTLSLTAGDWDVCGSVNFVIAAGTVSEMVASFGTSVAINTDGSEVYGGATAAVVTQKNGVTIPKFRVSSSGSTTLHLNAKATFAAGTVSGYGKLIARRVH